ncbi:MAG: hypothetical protein HYW79_01320 [Parcubacteria group bacterium]|nr:hypothetical protein [Parcubacteria group bacterium]
MDESRLEQPKVQETTEDNKEKSHADLAESMELDPRFSEIRSELVKDWEKASAPKDILTAEGQDFQFGDPTAFRRGEEPISLEERARNAFAERFPDDAKEYAEKEKVRVYENPKDDPAILETERRIAEMTNSHPEIQNIIRLGRGNYGETYDRAQLHASMGEWKWFIDTYPEKAQAYKDKFEPVKWRLEGIERRKKGEERQERLRTPDQEQVNEQFALRQLGGNYDHVSQTQERVLNLKKEAEESKKSLQELQRSAGFPETDTETASSKLFEEERGRLERESQALTLLEQHYLDLYSAETGEPIEGSEELEEQLVEKSREMEEVAEKTQEFLRREREKFITEFIKDGTEQVFQKFDRQFNESENGQKARNLLKVKIWHTVVNSEKEWIETGKGRGDLIGFKAALEIKKYKVPGQEKEKQFITNIKVEMMGEEDRAEIAELVNEQEKALLQRKEKEGTVKKEEKTS